MTILILGATGATGRLLCEQMLTQGHDVRVVVRSRNRLPDAVKSHPNLQITEASLLDLSEDELRDIVDGCTAIASCLGHNLTFRGMFCPPHWLVTDAAKRCCAAVAQTTTGQPVKYVLMNTTGNRNRDLHEKISAAQHIVIWLLRHILKPHADNERAADYLRTTIGQSDPMIEWSVVRPDGLIDVAKVTPYTTHPSPTRSAIFDAGNTSRINVAHFMGSLITETAIWHNWRGRMPVIYNATDVD